MSRIRLKKEKVLRSTVVYSEGFFGGLFRTGLALETNQLRQRFRGEIPDVIDVEITAPGFCEDPGRDERNEAIRARRATKAQELEDMQVEGILQRLEKKRKR